MGRSARIASTAGAAARQRGADAFALERIDESGGVADEEYASTRRIRANHADLEPTTERRRVGDVVDKTKITQGPRRTRGGGG